VKHTVTRLIYHTQSLKWIKVPKPHHCDRYSTLDVPWRIFIPDERRELLTSSLELKLSPTISQIGKSILALVYILKVLKPGLFQRLQMMQETASPEVDTPTWLVLLVPTGVSPR
jgi:hypothetical protein